MRTAWDRRQEEPAYYRWTMTGTAQDLGQVLREHGGLENRLPYGLDTALDADACRLRRNPGLLALIRHVALKLWRYHGKDNIKAAHYDHALSLDRLLAYDRI